MAHEKGSRELRGKLKVSIVLFEFWYLLNYKQTFIAKHFREQDDCDEALLWQ